MLTRGHVRVKMIPGSLTFVTSRSLSIQKGSHTRKRHCFSFSLSTAWAHHACHPNSLSPSTSHMLCTHMPVNCLHTYLISSKHQGRTNKTFCWVSALQCATPYIETNSEGPRRQFLSKHAIGFKKAVCFHRQIGLPAPKWQKKPKNTSTQQQINKH